MLAGPKFLQALVMQIAQGVGQFRLAQVGEALKEQLSGFVQTHGSLPTTQLRYGGAEVHNRIIEARNGAMTAGAVSHKRHTARDLLRSRNPHILELAVFHKSSSAFVQGEFAVDLVPMLSDHVFDSEARGSLLPGFGEKDDVAIEGGLFPMQPKENFKIGSYHALVIDGSPAIDVSIFDHRGEG